MLLYINYSRIMTSSLDKFLRHKLAVLAGAIANPFTFLAAVVISAIWIFYGKVHGYDKEWIDITVLVLAFFTFFVVFIDQFAGETELSAMQDKLDNLIMTDKKADNNLIEKENELQGLK